MAVITFQCYACNQVLQVGADNAGRKAKCSQCGTILTIPVLAAEAMIEGVTAAPVAPQPRRDEVAVARDEPAPRRRDDYDDDRPRRRRPDDYDDYPVRRASAPKWDKVKVGLLLAFIGLCVMAGAFAFVLLGVLVGMFTFTGARIFAQIGSTIFFLGSITAIVGHVFWLFVFSNKRGALGFAIAALAVAGVFLLVQLVTLAQTFGSFFGIGLTTLLFGALLRAAHFMMIAFYVRALAQWFDERRLESSAMLNVILCGCLGGYELVTNVILIAFVSSGFGQGFLIVSSIMHLLGGALIVVIFVFTLQTVHRCKSLLEVRARGDATSSADDIRR